MHACTCRPSLLFSQTTVAISMRKAGVRSQSAAGPSICCAMWLPHREGEIMSVIEGESRDILREVNCLLFVYSTEGCWVFFTELKCSFVSSTVPQAHLVRFLHPSITTDMDRPQSNSKHTTGVKMKITPAAGDRGLRTSLSYSSQLGS